MFALFLREVGGPWALLQTGSAVEMNDRLAQQKGEVFGTEESQNAGGKEIRLDGYMTGCVVKFDLKLNPWFASFIEEVA